MDLQNMSAKITSESSILYSLVHDVFMDSYLHVTELNIM